MTWLEILGWFIAFSIATGFWYRKGVKHGIHHALMILDLDQYQTDKLNKELKKNSLDIHKEMSSNVKYN
jgi:hypothetical protein